jgi:hypothetical protein
VPSRSRRTCGRGRSRHADVQPCKFLPVDHGLAPCSQPCGSRPSHHSRSSCESRWEGHGVILNTQVGCPPTPPRKRTRTAGGVRGRRRAYWSG